MEKNKAVGRGVRKGAWTKEEDNLLRKCVENYGEGKWHLVPPRAGLNRCRKSCRLRWLNYLRPNLKRGIFDKDEVDLIVRLHKLLGNKWSWIAGRIPGRTANDIKNFWNTHFDRKKSPPPSAAAGERSRKAAAVKNITESNIIRPRARTFSESQKRQPPTAANNRPTTDQTLLKTTNDDENENENPKMNKNPSSSSSDRPINDENNHKKKDSLILSSSLLDQEKDDQCVRWWADLLEMTEKEGASPPLLFSDDHHPLIDGTTLCDDDSNCANHDCLSSGLCLDDIDVWDFLSSHDH